MIKIIKLIIGNWKNKNPVPVFRQNHKPLIGMINCKNIFFTKQSTNPSYQNFSLNFKRINSMITIRNFMETINYRITEGSDYLWSCFGDHVYRLDSWDGHHDDGVSVGMIFDLQTQLVYQMEAHDYRSQCSYRWTHPQYAIAYNQEILEKLGSKDKDVAYDDVKYIDLELADDMLDKAAAIVNHREFDKRVKLPIDLNDDELFKLMLRAHEQDITLNQMVEKILSDFCDREKNNVAT